MIKDKTDTIDGRQWESEWWAGLLPAPGVPHCNFGAKIRNRPKRSPRPPPLISGEEEMGRVGKEPSGSPSMIP